MKVSTHYHDQLSPFLSISCVFLFIRRTLLHKNIPPASSPFPLKHSCILRSASAVHAPKSTIQRIKQRSNEDRLSSRKHSETLPKLTLRGTKHDGSYWRIHHLSQS